MGNWPPYVLQLQCCTYARSSQLWKVTVLRLPGGPNIMRDTEWFVEIAIVTSSFPRHQPIYPQVLGWMIRTPWNSYSVTKCHTCFCGQSARDSGSFNAGLRFWNGAFLNPPVAPSAFNWGIESMQSGGVRTASLGWRYHLQHHQQSSGHVYAGCWWSLSLLKQDFSFQVLLPWFSPLFFLGTG